MFEFPRYEEDGSEQLSFENIWMDGAPQEVLGAECFTPRVDLNPLDNIIELKLSAEEFTEMFSALYTGAIISYPSKYLQIMVNFLKGLHCPPEFEENTCKDFPPYAPFIEYPLQNPYSQPDLVPDGYVIPPMTVVTAENAGDYADSEIGDVIVNFNSFPLDSGWFDELHEDMPSLLLHVTGTGTIGVEFTPMIQGGLAIVTLDNPPDLVDILAGVITGADNIVDVNKDTLSVPPETADQIIFPLEITTPGEHIVYVVFFPIIDDSLIPIRFGGGIRKIEVCGFLETPTMSCEGLEDCLEESTIITNINTEITNINNTVNEMEDCGCGGNTYPPTPSPDEQDEEGFSKLCGAAWYIADKIIAQTSDFAANAGTDSLEGFLLNFLGNSGYTAQILSLVYQFWQDNDFAELDADIEETQAELAELLFCNQLDKDAFRQAVVDSETIPDGAVKDAILQSIDATNNSLWEQWVFIGGETRQEDCSGFCEWDVVWVFKAGSYTPDETENAIYEGDNWEKSGCNFDAGNGYVGLIDTWNISHDLPADCKVRTMVTGVAKNAPCTAVDISVTWRGTSGEDAPSQTDEQRCLSNSLCEQDWTILPLGVGAELDSMMVQSNHFLCDEEFGSQVFYVRMTGTGSRPSA